MEPDGTLEPEMKIWENTLRQKWEDPDVGNPMNLVCKLREQNLEQHGSSIGTIKEPWMDMGRH